MNHTQGEQGQRFRIIQQAGFGYCNFARMSQNWPRRGGATHAGFEHQGRKAWLPVGNAGEYYTPRAVTNMLLHNIKAPHTPSDDHSDLETLLAELNAAEVSVTAVRDQPKENLAEALLRWLSQ